MQVTLSEAIDRLTIVSIKIGAIQGDASDLSLAGLRAFANRQQLLAEQEQIAGYVRGLLDKVDEAASKKVTALTRELTTANKHIFDSVAFIEESDDLKRVGIAAKHAQALNRERSRLKNAIEEAVGSDVREVKL